MTILSSINAVKNLSTESIQGSVTDNKSNVAGQVFDEALEQAIKYKSLVLPGAANVAVDLGLEVLGQKDILSNSSDILSSKESMESQQFLVKIIFKLYKGCSRY